MRSEAWDDLAEELQDEGQFPETRPWETVIQLTTFGGKHIGQSWSHWWYMHVQAPSQRAGSATSFLQDIEGTRLLPFPEGFTTALPKSSGGGRNPRKHRAKSSSSSAPYPPVAPWSGKGGKGSKGGKGKDSKGKKGKVSSTIGESG